MSQQFWLNIPNMITIARVMAVPFMVWLIISHELQAAFWLFIAAGISDGVDGYLAKILKARTQIGAFLDPIADKLLLVSVFVVLGVQELIPLWLVIMVVFRDMAIVIGAALIELLTRDLKMSPNFSSKVNTTVQIVLLSFVLGVHGLEVTDMIWAIDVLVYITALTTLVSGLIYLYQWGINISKENGE
ncbi:putative phosphatidylglycerophosphate synthase [Candidatus Terasakiella magnetica]|uniref:CDP-diacylglycerol--glycerol-3-phosphate 3-phosphatidyltransferase n=1 Tax=Candidatus Terasakiella magnetica TaxID=1867952 RepID=A0A1C3RK69_9PROT|nr:CDP-alcohol phosphatidyltransferase family protein [Candidatus Terasakiella magnetica]SCA57633.1 putative phosphatidylglycerophosphate synthase [Candidatus Terasakiella magnetica]